MLRCQKETENSQILSKTVTAADEGCFWGTADIRSKIGNRLDENAIVTRQAPKDHFPEVEERSPGRSSVPKPFNVTGQVRTEGG